MAAHAAAQRRLLSLPLLALLLGLGCLAPRARASEEGGMQVEGLLQTPDDVKLPGRMHSEGVVQASISGMRTDGEGNIVSRWALLPAPYAPAAAAPMCSTMMGGVLLAVGQCPTSCSHARRSPMHLSAASLAPLPGAHTRAPVHGTEMTWAGCFGHALCSCKDQLSDLKSAA